MDIMKRILYITLFLLVSIFISSGCVANTPDKDTTHMNIIQAQTKTAEELYTMNQNGMGIYQSYEDARTGKTYMTGYVSRFDLPVVIVSNNTDVEISLDSVIGGVIEGSVMEMDNSTEDIQIWAVPTDPRDKQELCGPVYGRVNGSFQIETYVINADYDRIKIFAIWHNKHA
jgi:hypothetical protein